MVRRWAQYFGLTLGLVATVAFVIYAVRTLHGQDLSRYLSITAIIGIAVAAIGYSLIIPLSALAWRRLLADMAVNKSWSELCIIMSVTQLAKYIPGNVGQHVSRAAMSVSRGIPLRPYGISVLSEMVLAAIAASITGLLGCGLSGMSGKLLKTHGATALTFAAISASVFVLVLVIARRILPRLLRRLASGQQPSDQQVVLPSNGALAYALSVYVLNYVVFGTGITAMVILLLPGQPAQWLLLTGCFALAWVVGFFAPGAPAGMGVREGLMLGLLQFSYSQPDALLIVIALRIATTMGDVLCFAVGATVNFLPSRQPCADARTSNHVNGNDHET